MSRAFVEPRALDLCGWNLAGKCKLHPPQASGLDVLPFTRR